jgi:hypothetical protein
MRHDVDSPEALQATLWWYDVRRRAKRWVFPMPVVILVGIGCFDALHQTAPKSQHPVFLGPWMLKVDGS